MKENILQRATQFRLALEAVSKLNSVACIAAFDLFPKDCCGDASDLLGQFLLESLQLKGLQSICGLNPAGESHRWLWFDPWIIDITADQFEGETRSVIVEENKGDHLGFNHDLLIRDVILDQPCFPEWNDWQSCYQHILTHLPKS